MSTADLLNAAELLRQQDGPLADSVRVVVAELLEREAQIRETQPRGFYEVADADAVARAVLHDDVEVAYASHPVDVLQAAARIVRGPAREDVTIYRSPAPRPAPGERCEIGRDQHGKVNFTVVHRTPCRDGHADGVVTDLLGNVLR